MGSSDGVDGVDGGKFGIMEYDNVSIVEPKLGSHIPPKDW